MAVRSHPQGSVRARSAIDRLRFEEALIEPVEPLPIEWDREPCGRPEVSESLEWLVTNGAGAYASGTVSGMRTRRYHGLLVAALEPPAGRTVLVTDVFEEVEVDGIVHALHAARWRGGHVSPRGFEHIESFRLGRSLPVWRYAIGAVCLEKRIAMDRGRNTTSVRYRLVRGPAGGQGIGLRARVLVSYRDFHAVAKAGGSAMTVGSTEGEVRVTAFEGALPIRILGDAWDLTAAHNWYEHFHLAVEQDRGLDYEDDALHAATAVTRLAVGEDAMLSFSCETGVIDARGVWERAQGNERDVLASYAARAGHSVDPVGARLALAGDAFLTARPADSTPRMGVVAGYPWFGDWGRDTMIALPGLTLHAGRPGLARELILAWAKFVDRGMLPNRFPDAGGIPEYNTADATLWYIEAIRAYVAWTGDLEPARELWPVLLDIVAWHERGTRHGIAVDPLDGLLRSGEAGVQLTWMDAKVGDWVVTPRTGKCVEINALWYNGLSVLADLAGRLGFDSEPWRSKAKRVRRGMRRFEAAQGLFDVLDGPSGDDDAVRPNQILAVSLAASPYGPAKQREIVDVCARDLLTSHGLRSLSPGHHEYRGRYGGGVHSRDGAYHQGTIWAWLIGPFALAHYRVYRDAPTARSFLEPLVAHLRSSGTGFISEIFDGAPPHAPKGCFAQAWSVAEVLRAWSILAPATRIPAATEGE